MAVVARLATDDLGETGRGRADTFIAGTAIDDLEQRTDLVEDLRCDGLRREARTAAARAAGGNAARALEQLAEQVPAVGRHGVASMPSGMVPPRAGARWLVGSGAVMSLLDLPPLTYTRLPQ
jgi:hypothetical protein